MIDTEFLSWLACPRCDSRPPLEQRGAFLYCGVCEMSYPVIDGIPHLLPEEAVKASEASVA